MKKIGAVAVIGAGIAGMQASLDLAESGYRVYLIEKGQTIGGRMAQLDKTFPTGDCAMCTISPRMAGVTRHPNIKLLMNSEVTGLDGEPGNFKLKVRKDPRYVDEERCTGCGACAQVCPVQVPNEFTGGIGVRKAAYIPFAQAAPLIYTIDKDYCIDCGLCVLACEPDAVRHGQTEEVRTLHVGAIIVSTGYAQYNPSDILEYGYGEYPNVITNLQFERMLSASGPTGGHVLRPSDGAEPKNIAFIQCVGSRDQKRNPYCSKICCMASTKEAIVAKEHAPDLECHIFYMDMRAFGKGYQEYVDKAESEHGIRYTRGRVAKIMEDTDTMNLTLMVEDTETGKRLEKEFDMVVLASALIPSAGAERLAEVLGIETTPYGFYATNGRSPFDTSRDGIFVSGTCIEPKDIPDTIAEASGGAARCESFLRDVRGELVEVKELPPEKPVEGEPRVGVFVCHCGINIASVVDVEKVAKEVGKEANVVYATDVMYACSNTNLAEIKEAIEEHDLNRVVVASCTPRMHEPTFRNNCQEAGLNPYLFQMANIREHCSWVHSKEPEVATEKAEELVKMAVAKARLLTPEQKGRMELEGTVLVIGGGVAGMSAALECSRQGFNTIIVERKDALGGYYKDVYSISPEGHGPETLLEPLIKAVEDDERIVVAKSSVLQSIEGFTGNFTATIGTPSGEEKVKVGAVIVATGSEEKKPESYYYGSNRRVLTQNDLEQRLKGGQKTFGTTVMIQCVEARGKGYPSCSRTCCIDAIKNAIILRRLDPNNRVIILYRDIMAFGMYEDLYRDSQVKYGVEYMRYGDAMPVVDDGQDYLTVHVYDALLGRDVEIAAEHLVLSTPQMPAPGYEELQKILRVPLNSLGFYLEAHMKLRPLDFTSDGIFLCGNCHSPKELPLASAQALGAASRACSLLSKGFIETEATTSIVDAELCIGCGRCVAVCPFKAITLVENEMGEPKSNINTAMCKGCGLCASVCPNKAITPRFFATDQILAMIDAALEA